MLKTVIVYVSLDDAIEQWSRGFKAGQSCIQLTLKLTEDIDMEKLNLHLSLLPDAVKTVISDGIPIHQEMRVQTLWDVLNTQNCLKMLISEVHKLLKIYLTILVMQLFST